jgi:HSP20 family protein
MASFFEKLKKGMGIEEEDKIAVSKDEEKDGDKEETEKKEINKNEPEEEPEKKTEKKPATKPKKKKIKKSEKKAEEIKEVENKMEQKNEIKIEKESETKEKWSSFNKDQEGQLAIDVYQTDEFLVLQSAIAGVKPDSLDIVIESDMVSIKGNREKPEEKGDRNYFYQECFWGPFSRQIILSVEVDASRAEATLKEGILTIRLPKIERDKKRKLVVKG